MPHSQQQWEWQSIWHINSANIRHSADLRYPAAIWHGAIDNIRHLVNALGSTTEILGKTKPFSTAVGVARSTNGSLACLDMAAIRPHGISIYMQ